MLVESGNNSAEQQQTQQLKVGNAGGDDRNSFASTGFLRSNVVASEKKKMQSSTLNT